MMGSFDIEVSGGGVGAFVEGLDLSAGLDQGQIQDLRNALGEHGVLFFRDQKLTPEEHLAFGRCFSSINVNRFFQPVEGYPEIAEVRKEAHHKENVGQGWHTDHSYDQAPAMGSILVARELPPRGGDTLYASMYAAYDALSDGLKETLASLEAVHSSTHAFGAAAMKGHEEEMAGRVGNPQAATQNAIHPVVIRHPISGRRALYVNPDFTVRFHGWTYEESAPLLSYLYQHAAQPEFTYRFQWREGSLAFWDNRATWHNAVNDYHGHRRVMHRITLDGEQLQA